METEKDDACPPNDNPRASTAEAKEDNSQAAKLPKAIGWRARWGSRKTAPLPASSGSSIDGLEEVKNRPDKWSMGVLNDRETEEVPGQ